MAKKSKQHIIPKCYLKAWCDPRTPAGQQPYIWRVSKDGRQKRKKSPEKSFTATDKYTITMPDGERNLVIEDSLVDVENHFVRVLSRIRHRDKLNASDRARLCLFAAAMQTRTKAMGEHWKHQQQQLHDVVVRMEQAHNARPTTSLQTAEIVKQADKDIVRLGLQMMAPMLFQMEMTLLVTGDEVGFITSDTPCVWFNPKLHTFPPFYRSPGLAQEDIEVTLPLTPQHLLLISHQKYPLYVNVPQKAVDELNRRTRFHCTEEFVCWKGETKPYWFECREMPADAWENTEEGKRMLAEQEKMMRLQQEWQEAQKKAD